MRTSKNTAMAIMLLLAAVLLAGTAGLRGQETQATAKLIGDLGKAPASAAERRNPYDGNPEAVQAGRKLFRRHCAECHGAAAEGKGKAPALRGAEVRNSPPGVLFWFLKNGDMRAGMPSWSRLPDERLWQIVSYLKTLE